jgi:poly(3-hydroxybutyrate) depolymerase
MLYATYEVQRRFATPLHIAADATTVAIYALPAWLREMPTVRTWRAFSELMGLRLSHERPEFLIESVSIDGHEVEVSEETVACTPFAALTHFAKRGNLDQPRVLILPAVAGHFATLVRATVRAMLRDHDVFVADWFNARDVPNQAGPFGLDEYIAHVIEFLEAIGPDAHLAAICQPCPAALAAAAVMAEDDHPAQPRSLVLMAGPIDTRVEPGPVNQFATQHSLRALERAVIATVPWPHRGVGRRVYPGFVQALGFMSLDPRRHTFAMRGMFEGFAHGDSGAAMRTREFYREYFAVSDIAAELYLDTVRTVFMEHHLATGRVQWRGRNVNPSAIKTALLTIEGENDEICPPGQTAAALQLCGGIPKARRRRLLQAGVGHYGVFSGSRFEREIYPVIKSFIAEQERGGAGSMGRRTLIAEETSRNRAKF